MGHRLADVADSRCRQAASRQHFRSHFRSGGFAIGAGDADPLRWFAGRIAIHSQLPSKLNLTHHRNATTLRLKNKRRPRIEHRRSHNQINMIPVDAIKGVQISIRLLFIHAKHFFGAGTQHFHHALSGNSKTRHNHGLTAHIHIHHPSIVGTSYALIFLTCHSHVAAVRHINGTQQPSQTGTGDPITVENHQRN